MHTYNKNRKRRKALQAILRIVICVLTLTAIVLLISLISSLVFHEKKTVSYEEETIDASTDSDLPEEKESEEEEATGPDILVVCIDAGHGGKDGGASYGDRLEKDDTLRLAQKVREILEAQNISVVMTRDGDTYPTLTERCEIANAADADYFVSIHRNAGGGYGVETWISAHGNGEGKTLAENIMSGFDSAGIQDNRGIKSGSEGDSSRDWVVTRKSKMPSCLVEMGYIDNKKDNALFDENLTAYATAIADGVIATFHTYHPDGYLTQTEADAAAASAAESSSGDSASNTAANTSHTITNPVIDISSLSNSSEGWGPGSDCDEKNRPYSALSYQEKYGTYNANFIVPDSDKIYLTFDEGYENGCTPQILDTLKEKNVKAVFFVTMQFAKQNPDLIRRMIDEGHAVGNHSVTHPSKGLPSESVEQQQNEVMELHNYIKENFGYEMHLFRYPAGIFSEQSLAIVNNCNYKSVFWSFAYLDYDTANQPDPSAALTKVESRLHPGAIYLLHAVSTTNTSILGDFIDYIRSQGYEAGLFD